MKNILIYIKVFMNYIIQIFYIFLGYRKLEDISKVTEILFFKVGSMGDNIITLPMIASLKSANPNLNITMLTNQGEKNLVSIENLIDRSYIKEFINYRDGTPREIWAKLKKNQYDLIIDLTKPSSLFGTLRNMFFFRLLGLKYGLGWSVSELPFFRQEQDKYNLVPNEMQKYLSYLKPLHIPLQEEYILNITKDEKDYIEALLLHNNLKNGELIALVIGSKRDTNRWPLDHFDEVIRYIKEKTNYTPIVIGGKEDVELVSSLEEDILSFCGDLTPLQSAELLSRCKLVISNDTGPMHLSYAVGTYVIAIFSARDFREKWYPPKDKGTVLRDETIECRLCYKESCDDVKCMQSIQPKEVISMMDSLL